MNFFWLIHVLSLNANELIEFLGEVPDNSGVRGFQLYNNSFKILWLVGASSAPQDRRCGTEGIECWLQRTGLNHVGLGQGAELQITGQLFRPVRNLTTCIELIFEVRSPFVFTRHGIRRADEWHLIRSLARSIEIPARYRDHPP